MPSKTLLALLVPVLALAGCGDGDAEPAATTTDQAVVLSLPAGDPVSQSCLRLSDSVPVLAGLPTAFAGTVTSTDGGQVALDVDRWYAGESGDAVVLTDAPERQQALLGAVDFAVGEDYLVSAGADGVVTTCGLTGEAGGELQAAYDEAFGSG